MCPPTGDSRFSALCRTRICLPLRLHIPHPIRRTAQTDAKHPIHRTGGSKGSGGIAAKQAAATQQGNAIRILHGLGQLVHNQHHGFAARCHAAQQIQQLKPADPTASTFKYDEVPQFLLNFIAKIFVLAISWRFSHQQHFFIIIRAVSLTVKATGS